MMLMTGSPSSVAVEISETAVTPVAAQVVPMPAWRSMSNCMAPPAAAPPGTMRLNALPASWAVATGNHGLTSSARRSSAHMQAKLASSARTIGMPQSGLTCLSWGPEEKTAARLGQTTYRPSAVSPSTTARLIHTAVPLAALRFTTVTPGLCASGS